MKDLFSTIEGAVTQNLQMKDSAGFIKLHRALVKQPWYTDANTFRVFMHLLLDCNWEDKIWKNKSIKRGQVITSRNKLSQSLKISERSIITSLKKLVNTQVISIESSRTHSLITVLNYDKFQSEKRPTKRSSKNEENDQVINDDKTSNNHSFQDEEIKNDQVKTKKTINKTITTKEDKEIINNINIINNNSGQDDFKKFKKSKIFDFKGSEKLCGELATIPNLKQKLPKEFVDWWNDYPARPSDDGKLVAKTGAWGAFAVYQKLLGREEVTPKTITRATEEYGEHLSKNTWCCNAKPQTTLNRLLQLGLEVFIEQYGLGEEFLEKTPAFKDGVQSQLEKEKREEKRKDFEKFKNEFEIDFKNIQEEFSKKLSNNKTIHPIMKDVLLKGFNSPPSVNQNVIEINFSKALDRKSNDFIETFIKNHKTLNNPYVQNLQEKICFKF